MKTIHEGPWIIFIILIIVIDVFTHTKYLNHNSQRLHLPNIWNIVFDLEHFISSSCFYRLLMFLAFHEILKICGSNMIFSAVFSLKPKILLALLWPKLFLDNPREDKKLWHLAWLTLFRLNMFRLVFHNYSLIVL